MDEDKKLKKIKTGKNIVFLQKLKSKKLIIFLACFIILPVGYVMKAGFKKPASPVIVAQNQKVIEQKNILPVIANGRVLDVNQKPIQGAFVTLDKKSVITNKDGVWEIELLSKQTRNIKILANGYKKFDRQYIKAKEILLERMPEIPVSIIVKDKDEKPISNAFVLYLDSNSYKPEQIQKTDISGKVLFNNIPKDRGNFLVIMSGYKPGWNIADLKEKNNLAISLVETSPSSQMQSKDRNIEVFYDPSVKDKNKFKYSTVFKIQSEKLYEELRSTSSFDMDRALNNLNIFSSDSKQMPVSIGKINTSNTKQTDSQMIVFGTSLENDSIIQALPLSVVLTREYLLSITDKNDIISTILRLYSSEQFEKETGIVFKTENPENDENVESLHDASYLSYAVLSAKPEQKSDWYEYQSVDCLENFDIPLYKPHARVVLDGRYYGERDIYCEYHIEKDKSEVIGEGETKAVTNSIIGWYKKVMEKDGWKVVSDGNIIQLILFPRSEYIPAEFRKCKSKGDKIWDGTDLFVYDGIIPEAYGMFKDQFVFKLLMAQRRLFSPSQPELEYYGCPLETPTLTPVPTTKSLSVSGNIPREGCFDTDGGEKAGAAVGVEKGFDNPMVKGRVYINGKDYTMSGTKKIINEDRCGINGQLTEYRCANYGGKRNWAVSYTSFCPVLNTSCWDGACKQMPPEPTPMVITTKCSNALYGICLDCERPSDPDYKMCGTNNPNTPFCPKGENTCGFYKQATFNKSTFEWEFK